MKQRHDVSHVGGERGDVRRQTGQLSADHVDAESRLCQFVLNVRTYRVVADQRLARLGTCTSSACNCDAHSIFRSYYQAIIARKFKESIREILMEKKYSFAEKSYDTYSIIL